MERKKPPDVCVFHLVWAPFGLAPFEEFVASYRANPAELPHRLRIIFNGFTPGFDYTPYTTLLEGLEYDSLTTVQAVQDLAAYFTAVESVDTPFVCFLNSYCQIHEPGWLEKLYRHARGERVGVVGATGSYESPRSYWWVYEGLPQWRYYRFLCRHLGPFLPGLTAGATSPDSYWIRHLRDFPRYPNPHIRTNSFMIGRETMLRLRFRKLVDKVNCHKFECGRRSMTRQLLKKGLEPLVVGRDGRAYRIGQWYESRTFRSGDQSNLLISDNHTRYYAGADTEERRRVAGLAWGKRGASAEELAGRPVAWPVGKLDA